MGSLIGLVAGRTLFGKTITDAAAKWIVSAGLFLAALLFLFGLWSWVKHDIIAQHDAKLEQRAKPATDKAADERANDAIENARNEKEAHDAIAAQPDQPISPTSRALSCKRLHDIGRNPPACR
jgi:choline-glycine betaine transporter